MPQDQTFDADEFMAGTIDAPMATESELVPKGFHRAMIDDFDSKIIQKFDFTYKSGDRAGEPGSMTRARLPFSIQEPTILQALDRSKVNVEMDLIVDVKDGKLDFGKNKNIRLGQVREAVGQNTPGSWSLLNLRGAGPVMVQVVHEEFERKDGSKGKKAVVSRIAPYRA